MGMSSAAGETWSLPRRIAFRFAFAYLILYGLQSFLNVLPGTTWLAEAPDKLLWHRLVPWVGKHVLCLRTDITVFANGSGDTTFNYVQLLCYVALAAAVTLAWSLASARRTEHASLHAFLRVYVRYVLAVTMVGYGMSKVLVGQFPFPGPERLFTPYGQSSPMGLLWTFMGYSTAYAAFAGAGEVLGGLLLFFRRTTTLGALVVAAVMSNVVMLNFSYDVPVKLYSSHLLLMAVFLLIPDLRRLADVFWFNRPTVPWAARAPLRARWMERGRLGLKALFIGFVLFTTLDQVLEIQAIVGDAAPTPALYGIYEVEGFLRDGEDRPPLITDAARWRRVIFNKRKVMSVQLMSDAMQRFRLVNDPAKQTLALSSVGEPSQKFELAYSRPDADHLVLSGTVMNDALTVRLRHVDDVSFPLVTRGFHWINEAPYNR